MKKNTLVLGLILAGILQASTVYAQTSADESSTSTSSSEETATYLFNLGTDFGYDITTPAPSPFVATLLSSTLNVASMGDQFLTVLFASRPVSSLVPQFTTGTPYDSFLNPQANVLYASTYATPATQSATQISVVTNLDQTPYQPNPVDQAILNNIAPGPSYCPYGTEGCLGSGTMMQTILLDIIDPSTNNLPSEGDIFTPAVTGVFAGELNSELLLSPLLYSTTAIQSNIKGGVPTATQELLAADYVRYVTNLAIPASYITSDTYASLWSTAATPITSSLSSDQISSIWAARNQLATAAIQTRTWNAQNTLPISNFYRSFGLRKAVKVTTADGTEALTSEALDQFVKATYRVYNPKAAAGQQWIDLINTASPSTVQKEIAAVLADLLYQTYLNGQTLERLLLTNSVSAIQSSSVYQPGNQPAASSSSGS